VRTADLYDLTRHQNHLDAEHVVGRHAILQAVGAAGIHREIAGQRAGKLT
jgi:hypothetical protein